MSNLINQSFILPSGQVIKNRICKAAMTERIAKGNNLAHQGHVNLYDRWADGDIGILLTGNVQVDHRNLEGPANVVIDSNNYKEQLDDLKGSGLQLEQKIILSYGCKFLMLGDKHLVK
jgi:2,4-dienoyl-CoA reductase-like NADH-dependent reductase (Old Yellow Enzyme family)